MLGARVLCRYGCFPEGLKGFCPKGLGFPDLGSVHLGFGAFRAWYIVVEKYKESRGTVWVSIRFPVGVGFRCTLASGRLIAKGGPSICFRLEGHLDVPNGAVYGEIDMDSCRRYRPFWEPQILDPISYVGLQVENPWRRQLFPT